MRALKQPLKIHPNYGETFPWPCVCLSQCTCVAGDRGESGGSLHGSSRADGAAKPEQELTA